MRIGDGWTAGDAETAGKDTRGWFLGPFVDYAPRLAAHGVQVKWSRSSACDARSDWATGDETTSLAIVIDGSLLMQFRDEAVLLRPGEFVVWTRVDHRWTAVTDCTVVTVRWVDAPREPASESED